MSTAVDTTTDIRTFRIDIADEQIDDLRRRIAATRWPSKELVDDRSQGVQLATMKELARYWTTDYDWRKCEARLNALPQFTTEIDGVDIHFIHVRSPHEDALPLIMTHGWPGSVIELLETVGPLTDPTAHGGDAEDAFHLVLPSIPGYGFSGEPTELGWDAGSHRASLGGADAPPRLHPLRRPGRRPGSRRHRRDGPRRRPRGCSASTSTCSRRWSCPASPSSCRRSPSRNARRSMRSTRSRRTAPATSWRWPPGRRRSATRCWTHPSPSRPGCSTTTRTATTRSPARSSTAGRPGNLTQEHIVDNVTLYWLTGTGASAARDYWEDGRARARFAVEPPPPASVPVGFTTFPDEVWAAPRSWVEVAYPDLAYFNEVDRGGHFAAWEEPELFSTEVRAAFRGLR